MRLRTLIWDKITILAYHRVLDTWDEKDFDFDLDLISASAADFRWQMTYVCKYFTPITFRTMLDHLDNNAPLPHNPIVVTFDDGFDDNYHHAYPVLKSLGMPATIFVSTGYMDQQRTFWFDWLHYLCFRAAASRTSIHFADADFPVSKNATDRRANVVSLVNHAKSLPDDRLRSALTALGHDLQIEYPANGFEHSRTLTWTQIREMAGHGIEFGSHSVTHPILTNLVETRLREEMTNSKTRLEQELSCDVQVIAYPDGGDLAVNESVINAARAAGYRLGVCYLPGVNWVNSEDRFRLRRLPIERYTTPADFKGMLALPELLS